MTFPQFLRFVSGYFIALENYSPGPVTVGDVRTFLAMYGKLRGREVTLFEGRCLVYESGSPARSKDARKREPMSDA